MARKPVSQSRTMWVKKGTIVDGKEIKKGYLAQYGKPERKVTGRVALVTGQSSMGATSTYKAGRKVKPKVSTTKAPAAKPRGGSGAGGGTTKPPTPPAKKKDLVNTRKARDAAMAGRRGLTSSSRGRTPMSGTVSSAIAGSKPPAPKGSSGSVGLSSSNRLPSGSGKGDWVTQAATAAFAASKNAKPPASSSGPKKGDLKQTMTGTSIYNGSRWVKAVKRKGKWVAA